MKVRHLKRRTYCSIGFDSLTDLVLPDIRSLDITKVLPNIGGANLVKLLAYVKVPSFKEPGTAPDPDGE